jgi:hypothetical protein
MLGCTSSFQYVSLSHAVIACLDTGEASECQVVKGSTAQTYNTSHDAGRAQPGITKVRRSRWQQDTGMNNLERR